MHIYMAYLRGLGKRKKTSVWKGPTTLHSDSASSRPEKPHVKCSCCVLDYTIHRAR